ncbi:MAG TPA: hypothetical protein VNE71_13880 [Myxococcota bacterium]|nr:hypothetical protein [Myxococcota bacterium]
MSAGPGVRAIAPLLAGVLLPLAAAGGEVALSFGDAPGGATRGFRIERRAAGAVRFEPVALVGPGVAEFVDRGLPDGNRYCYRVRSLMDGAPAWSPEVCAVAEPEAADEPAPPPPPSVAAPEASRAEPSEAPPEAPPSSAPSPPRRIRTSGGWLQVLD